jgi:hypothetical protein
MTVESSKKEKRGKKVKPASQDARKATSYLTRVV